MVGLALLCLATPAQAAITIASPTSLALPPAQPGQAYPGQSFTHTGCPAGTLVTWSATSLLSGLSVSAGGVLSGTLSATQPVVNDTLTVTATVLGNAGTPTCKNGDTATKTYVLPVVYKFLASRFGGSNAKPSAVEVHRGGDNEVYVAESGSNQVWSIEQGTTNPPNTVIQNPSLVTMPNLNWPNGLADLGTNDDVLTTNFYGGSSAVSRDNAASVFTLAGCRSAAGVEITNSTFGGIRPAFVACAGSNQVFQLDPSTGTVAGSVSLASGANGTPAPAGVVPNPVNNMPSPNANVTMLVGDAQNDTLTLLAPGSTGPTQLDQQALETGCVPANIAVADTGASPRNVYIACPGTGTINQVTVDNVGPDYLSSPTVIPTGNTATSRPFGIAYDGAANQVVLTNSGDDNVRVFAVSDPSTQTVIPVGDTPAGVGLFPNLVGGISLAYVAAAGDGTVWVVDPPGAKKWKKLAKKNRRSPCLTTSGAEVPAPGEVDAGAPPVTGTEPDDPESGPDDDTPPDGETPAGSDTPAVGDTPVDGDSPDDTSGDVSETTPEGDPSQAEPDSGTSTSEPQATASGNKRKKKKKKEEDTNNGDGSCVSTRHGALAMSSRHRRGGGMSKEENIALLRSRATTQPLIPPLD